jgi:hypothetical protein
MDNLGICQTISKRTPMLRRHFHHQYPVRRGRHTSFNRHSSHPLLNELFQFLHRRVIAIQHRSRRREHIPHGRRLKAIEAQPGRFIINQPPLAMFTETAPSDLLGTVLLVCCRYPDLVALKAAHLVVGRAIALLAALYAHVAGCSRMTAGEGVCAHRFTLKSIQLCFHPMNRSTPSRSSYW